MSMVKAETKFEGELFDLLHRLYEKRKRLQARYERDLAEVDRQIEGVQITGRIMQDPAENGLDTFDPVIPNNLTGKSVRVACIEIAKQNNGILKVKDAIPMLLGASVLKQKKNAWGIIYTACARSEEFEKDPRSSGTFNLVGDVHAN